MPLTPSTNLQMALPTLHDKLLQEMVTLFAPTSTPDRSPTTVNTFMILPQIIHHISHRVLSTRIILSRSWHHSIDDTFGPSQQVRFIPLIASADLPLFATDVAEFGSAWATAEFHALAGVLSVGLSS